MQERMPQEIPKKLREIFMAPWNVNNAFIILWEYGDGSNHKNNTSKAAQNIISFVNTEKCQINAIAKILGLEDRIRENPPKDPKHKLTYYIAWSDQLLSDYLHKMGLRVNKRKFGAKFPEDFPNELMDIGAYGFWLANGGITLNSRTPAVYFYSGKEFLTDFQTELEKHVNFPSGIGGVYKALKTSEGRVNQYSLRYSGRFSYRILSAMFKRTADICWSVKRDKTIKIVSNWTNILLNKRDKAKKPAPPSKVKGIVALYDATDLMEAETRERYLEHCEPWIDAVRSRAEENWYLKKGYSKK